MNKAQYREICHYCSQPIEVGDQMLTFEINGVQVYVHFRCCFGQKPAEAK